MIFFNPLTSLLTFLITIFLAFSTTTVTAQENVNLPPKINVESSDISLIASPDIKAKAFMLYDMKADQVLAQKEMNLQLEPASLTKMMTAYLTFTALKNKKIQPTQSVMPLSMIGDIEGSRMFLDVNKAVTIDDLIKGLMIHSGNDAAMTLAQTVGGSVEKFVVMMNEQAKIFGMTNTKFKNPTGLPDSEHVSTAFDLALLAKHIIEDFPEYYPIYSQKEFSYNGINQQNRNRLLWIDDSVDGIKTGHTDNAGYCLVSSAKRGERRLISVVVGTDSDEERAHESQKLLNFGYQDFDVVKVREANESFGKIEVWKGDADEVGVGFTYDLYVAVPKGQAKNLGLRPTKPSKKLFAPVPLYQPLLDVEVLINGQKIRTLKAQALQEVKLGNVISQKIDSFLLWINND